MAKKCFRYYLVSSCERDGLKSRPLTNLCPICHAPYEYYKIEYKEEPTPSPDKPPGVEDWQPGDFAYYDGNPQEICRIVSWEKDAGILDVMNLAGIHNIVSVNDVTRFRRSTDLLQKGDQVMFGSKKGWIVYDKADPLFDRPYKVNFEENTNYFVEKQTHGWFHREDLTLTEPVYEKEE